MGKRSYRQNCALARTGDLIGERWTLLLIRDLLIGPRRFKDLSGSMKGMGSNLLATRLRELEAAGIVERQPLESGGRVYALTVRGRALEPAVLALVRWGLTYEPEPQEGFHHRDDWDLLALKSMFQPERAIDLRLTVQFRSPELTGWMRIAAGRIDIGLGDAACADLVISTTIKELFTGGGPPARHLDSGTEEELLRFMHAFALRV